jgi:preprotein translocase subunit SecF
MINFLQYTKVYIAISATVILIGLFTIATNGFKLGIDFTGGTIQEYTGVNAGSFVAIKELAGEKAEVTMNQANVSIKTTSLSSTDEAKLKQDVLTIASGSSLLSSETVGPSLGAELMRKTLLAALLGMLGIFAYLAYSFNNAKFAFAAIGALLHDILVVLGVYAVLSYFFGAEVNALFVTALLTTMSFSVHDTIIIFDKIRELQRSHAKMTIEEQANIALQQTLVRSFNNSMAALFMLSALLFIGDISIKFFLAALSIGVVTGAYSSPFVAVPLLVRLYQKK